MRFKIGLRETTDFFLLNLVQVQKWSFALAETPDFELDLV